MPVYNNKNYIKLMRPIPENWPLDKEGIPFVKKSDINISDINNGKWLISISNANINDKFANKKIVHCFKDNDELERFFNNPYMFLEKVGSYHACSTLDFGMHPGMKRAQIIEATFNNRWSGIWLQMHGIEKVIVTVGWIDESTYDICFSGIEDGTILLISTLGVCNDESKVLFLNGYHELRKRFPHSKIICVGNRINGMDDDVCYVKYRDSFGNRDKYQKYWQPSLFNWDGSEVDTYVI